MSDNNTIIGQNLKAIRQKREYTQKQVYTYLNCTRNMYEKIETGKNELTVKRMLKLCKLYRCSPNMLLKGAY